MSEDTQYAARPSGAFVHVPTVRVGPVLWLTILMGWTLLMPLRSHVSTPWTQSPAWPPEGGFVAEAALDLQEAFEPWRWNTGPDAWTGGDVGASAPLNSNYTLWIFGDTLLGHWNEARKQRISAGVGMPHSSVGVWNLRARNSTAPVAWSVGASRSSFFRPHWESPKQAFWAASAATVKGVVAVFGNRVLYTGAGGPFGFFSNESVVFLVSGASDRPSAPLDWQLSEFFVPHTGNITSGEDGSWSYLDLSKGVINHGGFVYLFGFVQVHPSAEQN